MTRPEVSQHEIAFWRSLSRERQEHYYSFIRRMQDPREQAAVAARQHAVPSPLLARLKGERT